MWNAITAILTIIGAVLANVLLIIFWLDDKVETNNIKVGNAIIQNTVRVDNMVSENSKRFEEVYKILIRQTEKTTDTTADIDKIDELLETHGVLLESLADTASKNDESSRTP